MLSSALGAAVPLTVRVHRTRLLAQTFKLTAAPAPTQHVVVPSPRRASELFVHTLSTGSSASYRGRLVTSTDASHITQRSVQQIEPVSSAADLCYMLFSRALCTFFRFAILSTVQPTLPMAVTSSQIIVETISRSHMAGCFPGS